MRKFSLLLLVAVVMAGAIYAVHAYAENGGVAKIDAKATSAVSQCPKNADCPRDCEGCPCPGQCANRPNCADKDKDGQCDQRGAGPTQGCSVRPAWLGSCIAP
jgi:hypothetical protein